LLAAPSTAIIGIEAVVGLQRLNELLDGNRRHPSVRRLFLDGQLICSNGSVETLHN
jgi:hypothetical protein